MREALFQEKKDDGKVQCRLCSHGCIIGQGQKGACNVRRVEGKGLFTVADKVVALHVDPIEKKPLYHVLPGSLTMSFATVGCNLACSFCQNSSISQWDGDSPPGEEIGVDEIIKAALSRSCPSIAATYTEPTIFFETAREVGLSARKQGLLNLWVSNGFFSREVRLDLETWLDGINIDLKAFSDEFYRKYCNGRLDPVLENIAELWEKGVWIEVTTLLIPGLNDSDAELREISRFLAGISPQIPWHVSAFHPDYRMLDKGRTPVKRLTTAKEIAKENGLEQVYIGNVAIPGGGDTVCPSCKTILVERSRFTCEIAVGFKNGTCQSCGIRIPGLWG